MVNQIQKNIDKLSPPNTLITHELMVLIVTNRLTGLNIQKIKGQQHIYRVRKKRVRIIFERRDGVNQILYVGLRTDKTYMAY
ncbi:MAG: hypothetical protein RJB39_138 [Candidatus Parcubacteria bacterium]|jgi:mRNA-degrading endonuclease RelE of RelBE toxin-antitoxin system